VSWKFVGAVVVAFAPACLLTTSLDGLSGPADDAGAGADRASAEAGGGDGPVTDTASADVVDAARPFRCADQVAVFCADFDTDPFDVGFSDTIAPAGGTLSAGPGRFDRGLVAQTPVRNTATRPGASRVKFLDMIPARTSFTYAYDILVEPASGAGTLDYGGFYFNGPFYTMSLRSSDDGKVFLHEYADADLVGGFPELNRSRPLAHGLAPGVWSHVAIKITFSPGASALKVTFDNEVMADGMSIDAYRYADDNPKIPVGIFGAEDVGKAVKMTFDDVLVTMP
jgi:hypothetical protein